MRNVNYNKLMIMSLMLLCLGVGAGSIFLMKVDSDSISHIQEYLNSFFSIAQGSTEKSKILRNAITDNLILAGVIFLCGFFKAGIPLVGLCIARKGFIMGFTSASMLKCFGIKGLLINMAYIPTMLLALPALMFFSVRSVNVAYQDTEIKKKLLFNYIFFAIITISIFCVAAVFEAYLTTTFMKFIFPKL